MDRLCLGTAQLGFDYGVANPNGQPSYTDSLGIIHAAFKRGVREFDTAQAYGESEVVLGQIFQDLGIQEQVRVFTKLPPDYTHESRDGLQEVLTASRRRLKISRLAGLLAHRIENVPDWERFHAHIEELRNSLEIEALGISLYTPEEALRHVQIPEIRIIQVPMNLLDRRFLYSGFFEQAETQGVHVYLRSIYLQGLVFLSKAELERKGFGWAQPTLKFFRDFLEKHEVDAATLAWKIIRQTLPRTTIVVGVESLQQLKENLVQDLKPDLDQEMIDEWWEEQHAVPERLLNPSHW